MKRIIPKIVLIDIRENRISYFWGYLVHSFIKHLSCFRFFCLFNYSIFWIDDVYFRNNFYYWPYMGNDVWLETKEMVVVVVKTVIKLTILTLVVLELLALMTHLDVILATISASITAIIPSVILFFAIIYLITLFFR